MEICFKITSVAAHNCFPIWSFHLKIIIMKEKASVDQHQQRIPLKQLLPVIADHECFMSAVLNSDCQVIISLDALYHKVLYLDVQLMPLRCQLQMADV